MRSRYKLINEGALYFITSTIVEWIPIFTSDKYFHIIIDSLKYCIKEKELKIYSFVILDNHLHLIVSGNNLQSTIQTFKRHTAKIILQCLKEDKKEWILNQLQFFKLKHKTNSQYQVWQEGYHPEEIMSNEMFVQKTDYMHYNPVKRGYVKQEVDWRFSSARALINNEKGELELAEIY